MSNAVATVTYDDIVKSLPARLVNSIPASAIASINAALADPDMGETFRQNIITYQGVLQEGRFKAVNYIDAVQYVSHKLRGLTNKDAYHRTFPDKILDWDTRNVAEKDRNSYISSYHSSKLVTMLLEQAIVPTWIINQDLFQEALNAQADLMRNAKSEMVRFSAGKALLEALKRPEAVQLKVDIGAKESSVISALSKQVEELVISQKRAIELGGKTARDVAEMPLVIEEAVEGEYSELK